jgi:hypothetical protein
MHILSSPPQRRRGDFAIPTQTRYLARDPMRNLTVGIEKADGPLAAGPKLGESLNLGEAWRPAFEHHHAPVLDLVFRDLQRDLR